MVLFHPMPRYWGMVRFRGLHRRSIRLTGFDYGRPGWYFLTFCCHQTLLPGQYFRARPRGPFGVVRGPVAQLGPLGEMIAQEWVRLEERFPWAELGEWVVMPDHLHGLVYVNDWAGYLPRLVQAFKSTTTWRVKRELLAGQVMQRGTRLWQRNYYESVIRDARHLAAVRNYIVRNPARMAGKRFAGGAPRTGHGLVTDR